MSRSPIRDQHGTVVAYINMKPPEQRTCPRCNGLGHVVHSSFQKQDPVCPLCKGKGKVSTVVCRNCGLPASKEVRGIYFCGEVKCFEELVPKVEKVTTYQSNGYGEFWRDRHGMGGENWEF